MNFKYFYNKVIKTFIISIIYLIEDSPFPQQIW